MTKSTSYHDAEIVGLFHEESEGSLSLNIIFPNKNKSLIIFEKVIGWDLSPFQEQNTIFDLHEFNQETLPEWIIKVFNIPQEYIELINSNSKKLFYIDASVGLGGYIIAKKMSVN
ncbi:MAG TPA: hypothetical protein VGV92_06725 [Gammaproteobacteria bacterium]|nr:hypothetical protein [Gammaproteobacteria bacterium]